MNRVLDKVKLFFSSIVDLFKKYKYWFLVGLLLAVLVSVVVIYTTSNSNMLGKEVSLKLGQSLSIKSENLEIKFLEVVSDSRCPKGANCIWAGQAIVMIKVFKSGEDLGNFKLIDQNNARVYSTQVDVYKISLLKVEPYPKVNKNINSDDYRITIRVDKV